MSLVVFPFKDEDLEAVGANLAAAAGHPRVSEVWAVAAAEDAAMAGVSRIAADLGDTRGAPVIVFPQERMGRYRSGKGDGINTALDLAARRGFDRVHFYDADITNFGGEWIDGAEQAADRGYDVVRHRFPRAATDAMITWMVTRPGLALLFPGTLLPRLGQPLGGELLMTGEVVEALTTDPFVVARSDWGVDTVITHATTALGAGLYEHNIADGKRHSLYGSLSELRDMVLECLDAVASLRERPPPESGLDADPPAPVPPDLKVTVAYDSDATRASISDRPDERESIILDSLGVDPERPIEMDAERWRSVLPALIDRFRLDDPAWRSAVFRLWVERVFHYTAHEVPKGYDTAMEYLEGTIRDFEESAI